MNGFSRYLLSTLLLVLAGIASAEIETVTWLHADHYEEANIGLTYAPARPGGGPVWARGLM